jgi:hypothetical protein
MIHVYVDTGGWHSELRKLQVAGAIKAHHFPFENSNSKISIIVPGSGVTWAQSGHVTSKTDPGSWDDDEPSEIFEKLRRVVGSQHVDAQHLDSAYKARCSVFLTSDKGDIWSRRDEIRGLAGLLVLHMPSQIGELVAMCASDAGKFLES